MSNLKIYDMKKVESYVVTITELQGVREVSYRESTFKNLRQARSFYKTCVDFYLGMRQLSGLSHYVDISLLKEFIEDESILIDSFGKKF